MLEILRNVILQIGWLIQQLHIDREAKLCLIRIRYQYPVMRA
jgi:hypothetical protein